MWAGVEAQPGAVCVVGPGHGAQQQVNFKLLGTIQAPRRQGVAGAGTGEEGGACIPALYCMERTQFFHQKVMEAFVGMALDQSTHSLGLSIPQMRDWTRASLRVSPL